MESAADLLGILHKAKSELAKSMFDCIDAGDLKTIIEHLDTVFERQATAHEQPFFWIKPGKNPVLDLNRQSYNEYISVPSCRVEQRRNCSWWSNSTRRPRAILLCMWNTASVAATSSVSAEHRT